MDYFIDKVVLITGSARGIGLATARLLGQKGAKIVLSDILEDVLTEAEEDLRGEGIEVLAVKADVTSADSCRQLVKSAVEHFGKLDVLINNAGVSIVDYFENCTPEIAKKLMDVNLMGCIYMSLAGLDELKKTKGHLIFVSSLSGVRSIPTGSLYGSSKAALRSLAESIRLELMPYGIHVGVVSPGFTTTDSSKSVMQGDGTLRPIDRPPHDTPEGLAKTIAVLIEKRKREMVTTAFGKLGVFMQRLSPSLVDFFLKGKEMKN